MVYHYCLTIKKNDGIVFIKDYDDYLERFKQKFPNTELDIYYEYDTVGRLHAHCLVTSPRRLYKNRLERLQGYTLDFDATKNLDAWTAYITKQLDKQTDIVNQEYQFYTDVNARCDVSCCTHI